ncbi:uncharacterized protein F5147DRAFT_660269 [Suillus discolor]|uniref:Uncharacterized protein n=1 Tax=Suillus discolor TaxID=1912936 RepID=A0A9P7ERB4_9AGAM|nr:uncharacterized protein F5147DRAFT_660269 [Suillus discolor]KAG2083125.1 hypothetical protein F5147DRAFT_660269 [Suillus discolor]
MIYEPTQNNQPSNVHEASISQKFNLEPVEMKHSRKKRKLGTEKASTAKDIAAPATSTKLMQSYSQASSQAKNQPESTSSRIFSFMPLSPGTIARLEVFDRMLEIDTDNSPFNDHYTADYDTTDVWDSMPHSPPPHSLQNVLTSKIISEAEPSRAYVTNPNSTDFIASPPQDQTEGDGEEKAHPPIHPLNAFEAREKLKEAIPKFAKNGQWERLSLQEQKRKDISAEHVMWTSKHAQWEQEHKDIAAERAMGKQEYKATVKKHMQTDKALTANIKQLNSPSDVARSQTTAVNQYISLWEGTSAFLEEKSDKSTASPPKPGELVHRPWKDSSSTTTTTTGSLLQADTSGAEVREEPEEVEEGKC